MNTSQEVADEIFEAMVGLCNKVAVDAEDGGSVSIDDLVELREAINAIRKHIAGGGGYKLFPRVRRPGVDVT